MSFQWVTPFETVQRLEIMTIPVLATLATFMYIDRPSRASYSKWAWCNVHLFHPFRLRWGLGRSPPQCALSESIVRKWSVSCPNDKTNIFKHDLREDLPNIWVETTLVAAMVHIFQRWKPVCWNMTERLIDSIWRGGVARGDYERKDMIHDLLSRCAAPNFLLRMRGGGGS